MPCTDGGAHARQCPRVSVHHSQPSRPLTCGGLRLWRKCKPTVLASGTGGKGQGKGEGTRETRGTAASAPQGVPHTAFPITPKPEELCNETCTKSTGSTSCLPSSQQPSVVRRPPPPFLNPHPQLTRACYCCAQKRMFCQRMHICAVADILLPATLPASAARAARTHMPPPLHGACCVARVHAMQRPSRKLWQVGLLRSRRRCLLAPQLPQPPLLHCHLRRCVKQRHQRRHCHTGRLVLLCERECRLLAHHVKLVQ
mmetsp:Transcript_23409/g.69543  ORF Transcript_23409/g.69543 Transcript_23409/m.69543 type:complete len:256 (+) Transcript_23409:483-1250(+)